MRFGLITALALLFPVAVSAQLLGGTGGATGETFSVSVSPQYPMPHSSVTVSALSNTLDLTNSKMTVSVAGTILYQGNVQGVNVPVGKAGAVTTVTVAIAAGGVSYKQTVLVQPQDVALIAEPLSSVPPLYPGKPSTPLEGNVRVVAAASLTNAAGKPLDPAALAYAWTVDGTRIAGSSGIGKSALIVASPLQYRSRDVSVSVTSQDGQLVGGASLSLIPLSPTVRLYVNDPLLGILFDRALTDSYTITGSEATLYAAPFSLPTTTGAPLVQWFLNGSAAQSGPLITLRPSGSGSGSATLSLTASGGGQTTISTSLPLIFGSTASSNFFGL